MLGVDGSNAASMHALLVVLVTIIVSAPSVALIATLSAALLRRADGRSGPRVSHTAAREHSRLWFEKDVPRMSPADFARTFRVPRVIFDMLVASASLAVVFSAPEHLYPLPVALQVAMALYKLGRPISYFDLAQKFGVSPASAHRAVQRVVLFLIQTYAQTQIFNRWPTTPAACEAYAAGMALRTGDPARPLNFCIGALDGTFIPIFCPDWLQNLYFCRKGFYALSFQVVCNALGFIIWAGGARPGSSWDGNCIKNETLEYLLAALPPGYFIIADSGYVGTGRILTPFKRQRGQTLTRLQEHWNYLHSLVRGIIEKVFGVLKAKWRWMLRGVKMDAPETYANHFLACSIIHNMVIEHNMGLSYGASQSVKRADEDGWVDIADIDDDDAIFVKWLKGRYKKLAGNVEAYVRRHADAARDFLLRRSGNAAGGAAAEHAVAEDAVDSFEAPIVIDDAASGRALRTRVYDDMKMSSWKPRAADDLHQQYRAMRQRARSTARA